jgi:hypothetical protein
MLLILMLVICCLLGPRTSFLKVEAVFYSETLVSMQNCMRVTGYKTTMSADRGRIEMTGRRGRRRKQLLDDLKKKKIYWKLK